jgi:hypothetical protein
MPELLWISIISLGIMMLCNFVRGFLKADLQL